MKACIYTALLLLAAQEVSAQCNVHRKTDEFTHKTVVYTDKVKITTGGLSSMFKKFDDHCRYKIYFELIVNDIGKIVLAMSEDSDDCVCTISQVSFKFSDGTVLIRNSYNEGETVKTQLGEERVTYFDLSKEELRELSGNNIVKFKLSEPGCSDHPTIQEEMGDKEGGKIKDAAACILKSIGHN